MTFAVTLSTDDTDFAAHLNDLRRQHTTHHKPAFIKDGDLIGCTGEVALCKAWGIPYTELGYDHGGGGDGGRDLLIHGIAIDLKSSAKNPDRWIVKYPRCNGPKKRADWYIFAYVEMPYTVHFLGKQSCQVISNLPPYPAMKGAHRVYLQNIEDISPDDFIRV